MSESPDPKDPTKKPTPPPAAPPKADLYARTEHTAGWVKLPASAEELFKEAEKVAAGE
jgi:hypothetical protein